MKKEIIGNATLYLGDCLEILPTLDKVDAVITDPPYGTAFVGGYNRNGDGIRNDEDLSCLQNMLSEAVKLDISDFLIFYSPRVAQDFKDAVKQIKWAGEAVWDKITPGMGGGFRYQHENIGIFGDIKRFSNAFSVFRFNRCADQHPHEKPIEVMNWLVGKYNADAILDPFMGSGTTGVACMNLGRKFIGIEIEPKYFDIACERIAQAQKQIRMFA